MRQARTVVSHAIRDSGTPLFCPPAREPLVAAPRDGPARRRERVTPPGEPALSPELALDYLAALSTDIRAGVLLDDTGSVVAYCGFGDDSAARLGELALELFSRAQEAAPPEMGAVAQVEVTSLDGGVFAVRRGSRVLAVVTGRFALASLMFYDLRSVLTDLEGVAA